MREAFEAIPGDLEVEAKACADDMVCQLYSKEIDGSERAWWFCCDAPPKALNEAIEGITVRD